MSGVHNIGRPRAALIAKVGSVLWQHAHGHDAGKEIVWVVDEEHALHRPSQRPWRQARAAHVASHDRDGLRDEIAPGVLIDPEASHLLDLHQPVVLQLTDKAQQLEDNGHVLQLSARLQVHRVPAELLDALFGDDLQLAHVLGEEVDVADTEACLLLDHACGPLLVGADGVIRPNVPTKHVVHGLHEVQERHARQGIHRPVRHPRNNARTSNVLPTANDVALVCPILAAGSYVLHRKGAVANNDGILSGDNAVVHLVKHAIADLAVKLVLTLVGLFSRDRQVPWVEEDCARVEICLILSICFGLELPVMELGNVDLLNGELVLVDHVPFVGGEHLGHAASDVKEVHILDVRLELAVRQDAILLANLVEVLQEPVAGGPRRVEHRRNGVVLVELKMVCTVLRLQF
mmetsp:Transcript_67384/g.150941  ORF Transcript_67384/g.150941 Transcript_67384/m.150941 type:complete len:404 (+) Transcript_67384:439-1650(+)